MGGTRWNQSTREASVERSEQVNELAAALAKAQAEIEPASKDAENPHLKSRYADLAAVWEVCRGPLTKNGLAVVQAPEPFEAGGEVGMVLRTTLFHSTGQYLSSTLPLAFDAGKMQSLGSAITYARRYALASLVGVVAEADDDGHQAVSPRRESDVNGGGEHERHEWQTAHRGPTRPDQRHGHKEGMNAPKNGKQLWAWLKEQGEKHEVDVVKWANAFMKLKAIDGRIVDLAREQVELVHAAAQKKLDGIGDDSSQYEEALAN